MREDIRDLMQSLTGYNPNFDIEKVLAQPNMDLFTHTEDGRIVAMTTLYVMYMFSRSVGVIEEVVTLPEYRNRGFGTLLINRAIEQARALRLTCVELTVREDKPELKTWYQSLGFVDRNQRSMRLFL